MKTEHDDDCAWRRGFECDCGYEEDKSDPEVKTVMVQCEHCGRNLIITEQAPQIQKGISGGIPYTRVGIDCQLCGKRTRVPENEETKKLWSDRLKTSGKNIYPGIY